MQQRKKNRAVEKRMTFDGEGVYLSPLARNIFLRGGGKKKRQLSQTVLIFDDVRAGTLGPPGRRRVEFGDARDRGWTSC